MCSTSHRGSLANPSPGLAAQTRLDHELVPHHKLSALLALVLATNPIRAPPWVHPLRGRRWRRRQRGLRWTRWTSRGTGLLWTSSHAFLLARFRHGSQGRAKLPPYYLSEQSLDRFRGAAGSHTRTTGCRLNVSEPSCGLSLSPRAKQRPGSHSTPYYLSGQSLDRVQGSACRWFCIHRPLMSHCLMVSLSL